MKQWLAATVVLTTALAPIHAWAADSGEGVTRMEAARTFSKTMGLPFSTKQTSGFADVAVGQEGWQHIAAVKDAGLMNRDGSGAFYPNETITREQMAVLLVKSFGLAPASHDRLELADASVVSAWAKDWVGTALDLGLMQAFDSNFKPLAVVTAEELTADLNNYWNRKFIEQTLANKRTALAAKDKAAFLNLLDPSQQEYREEQSHWFDDFISHDIQDFKIQIGRVERIDDRTLVAGIKQNYTYNGKDYTLEYLERFVLTAQGWRDADLNFATKSTDHFDIKYLPGDQKIAERAAQDAEAAYNDLQNKLPFDNMGKTTVKIYDDLEKLRQSVKLSFAWNFGGWYEFPESIKTNSQRGLETNFTKTIEHESIHKITTTWSKNNLPYWFAEGLATYYTNPASIVPQNDGPYKSIRELERINLETLTDSRDISQYYHNAALILRFFAETYGDPAVKRLILALGEYPYQQGTAADNDPVSQQRFAEAVPRVLGKSLDALDAEWLQWVNGKVQHK